jgi:palmitoyltransferase
MHRVIQDTLGQWAASLFTFLWNYLFYTNHPLGMVFYITASVLGYLVAMTKVDEFIPGPYLGSYHKELSKYMMGFGWFLYILAVIKNPGKIKPKKESEEPFDGVMYPEDAFCKTCNLTKPARSKHCSVCGFCVPHFDHHCVWLNRCVTKHNYLIFLAFVL